MKFHIHASNKCNNLMKITVCYSFLTSYASATEELGKQVNLKYFTWRRIKITRNKVNITIARTISLCFQLSCVQDGDDGGDGWLKLQQPRQNAGYFFIFSGNIFRQICSRKQHSSPIYFFPFFRHFIACAFSIFVLVTTASSAGRHFAITVTLNEIFFRAWLSFNFQKQWEPGYCSCRIVENIART